MTNTTSTTAEDTAQKESAPAGTKGAIQSKHVDSIAAPAHGQEVLAHKIAVPGGAVMMLPEAAAAINRHHTDATAHAQSAIDHARAAGDLLLRVKEELPHGEFIPWVEANCRVSARQAQRYMRASRGLPIAVTAPKNDTVSYLGDLHIDPDEMLIIVRTVEGWREEIFVVPAEEHPGRLYVMCMAGPVGEGCHAAATKRPIPPDWVNAMISRHLSGDMAGTKVSRTKVAAGLSREKWCELSGAPLREEWEVPHV